jgi:hypothetical protein
VGDWVVDAASKHLELAREYIVGNEAPRSDGDSVFETPAPERDHGAVGNREIDHRQQFGSDPFLGEFVIDEFGQGIEKAHETPCE